MRIPEELLTKSEKELKEYLPEVDNIFKAKYFIEDNYIFKNLGSVGRSVIYENENKSVGSMSNKSFRDYCTPFTYKELLNLKANSLDTKLSTLNNDSFRKILYRKTIEVFGEDYVDLISDDIIIWFPEIKITNSLDMEHIIKDFYLRLKFTDRLYEMYGARTSMTINELAKTYVFSHLDCSRIGKWSGSFCLGDDTPFRKIHRKMRYNKAEAFKNITLFLLSIKEYLSWESIEGVPYRRLSNLLESNPNLRTWNTSPTSTDITKYYSIAIDKLESLDYTFEFKEGETILKLTQPIVNNIERILTDNCEDSEKFIIQNDKNYIYNETTINDYKELDNTESSVFFKGAYIKNKVILDDVKKEEDFEKFIDRNILKKVISRIEGELLEYFINKKITA